VVKAVELKIKAAAFALTGKVRPIEERFHLRNAAPLDHIDIPKVVSKDGHPRGLDYWKTLRQVGPNEFASTIRRKATPDKGGPK